MTAPIQFVRGTVGGHMEIYHVPTMSWIKWDGSLTVGGVTIGKVDQGAAGLSAWLTHVDNMIPAVETGLAKEDTLGDILTELEAKTEPADAQTIANSLATVSTGNSSTDPLDEDEVFTGAWESLLPYRGMTVVISSDEDSADDGIQFQWSTNGTDVDAAEFACFCGDEIGRAFNLAPRAQYFRVVYINGGTAQGFFRLQTIYHPQDTGIFTRSLMQELNDSLLAQLTRSVIAGHTTAGGGGYVNVKVNPSGALTTEADVVAVPRLALLSASGQAGDAGNNLCVTPSIGTKLRIAYLSYNPVGAVACAFRFGVAGDLFLRNSTPAGGIVAKDFGDLRYIEGAEDEALYLNLGGAVATIWNVLYVEV